VLKSDRYVTLFGDAGASVAKSSHGRLGGLKPGNTLEVGSWEVEIDTPIPADDFVSGRVFLAAAAPVAPASAVVARVQPQAFKRFKSPVIPVMRKTAAQVAATPMYDPALPNTFVVSPGEHTDPADPTSPYSLAPVVMDPYLGKCLRPHQREGIRFLYKCVSGGAGVPGSGRGAILADSMGLGKSLQALSLLWTVLKQRGPLVRKAIIVCPASLVSNWVKEVNKWLGTERLKPVAVQSGSGGGSGANQELAAFVHGNRPLLIVSYDMLRVHVESINAGRGCGLLVCDEGHRLKASGGNKTIAALSALKCDRRVILTGTPVQNDLEEFFAMCSFVNPACLGTLSSFRSVFAAPILASRDASAGREERALGRARALELSRVTRLFVLRRTAATLEQFLPPKCESTLFCRMAPSQAELYATECSRGVRNLSRQRGFGAALSTIMTLRKVCAHPMLVASGSNDEEDGGAEGDERPAADTNWKSVSVSDAESGKFSVALAILDAVHDASDGRERTVLVSNFTRNLDLFESLFMERDIPFLRLDGSTPAVSRGSIVERFNRRHTVSKSNPAENTGEDLAVLLLSAKAGGVGLNLIGANHLILFDPDWNPATDHQSMGRVWRDGQKLRVNIYRLITTGAIEEKILQRQLFKGELQSVMDAGADGDAPGTGKGGGSSSGGGGDGGRHNFSVEELRELFRYNGDDTACDTLAVLESGRGGAAAVLTTEFLAYRESGEVPPNDLLKSVKDRTGNTLSYMFHTQSGRDSARLTAAATATVMAANDDDADAADLLVASRVTNVEGSPATAALKNRSRLVDDDDDDDAVEDEAEAMVVSAAPRKEAARPRREPCRKRPRGVADTSSEGSSGGVAVVAVTPSANGGGDGADNIDDDSRVDVGSDAAPATPRRFSTRSGGRRQAAPVPDYCGDSSDGNTDGSDGQGFDWEAELAQDEVDESPI